jgi:D-alanyl-D-alanine carboxypeptidase
MNLFSRFPAAALSACLVAPAVGAAQTPQPDAAAIARVDTTVAKAMTFAKVPGMSVAVARDGATIYTHAYGYANLATKAPATVQTHYEIGSITKQFTAAAILQLKEAGKLSLNDTLAGWISEYRRGAKVTIRQLLQQTTGIPNYTEVKGFEKIASTKPASFAAILALVARKPLEFEPGSRFEYSNTNYILLGEIVERASGTTWESYVRKNIFARAQMTHSGFIDDEAKLQPMATGYVVEKNVVTVAPQFGSGWAWSAGAIVSTVGDMLAWDAALFGGRLVNQTDLASMFAGGKEAGKGSAYGFGWVIDSAGGHKRYWHNGGTFGFLAANLVFPKDRMVVVVLQNAVTIVPPESTAQRIFEAFAPPTFVAAAAGENPAVTARVRDWLTRFESGNIDRTQLDSQMNKLVTPQLIEQVKQQLGPLGKPQSLVFLGKTNASGSIIYRYRADFAAMSFTILMEVNGLGKISGFRLLP